MDTQSMLGMKSAVRRFVNFKLCWLTSDVAALEKCHKQYKEQTTFQTTTSSHHGQRWSNEKLGCATHSQ